MSSIETTPLIPGSAPGDETASPNSAPVANTTAGTPPTIPPEPPTGAPAREPAPHVYLVRGQWAVTAVGLESLVTAGDPPQRVEYVIDKERLLRVRYDADQVGDWPVQLASKSWLNDPFGLLEAFEAALRIHHPGQTVIDMTATRDHALDQWGRTRRRPGEDDLVWEYEPGAATLAALERRRAARPPAQPEHKAAPPAAQPSSDCDPAWLDRYPEETRAVLRQHGLDPGSAPYAAEHNDHLVEKSREVVGIVVPGSVASLIVRVFSNVFNHVTHSRPCGRR